VTNSCQQQISRILCRHLLVLNERQRNVQKNIWVQLTTKHLGSFLQMGVCRVSLHSIVAVLPHMPACWAVP
jgi:hypothetical protein